MKCVEKIAEYLNYACRHHRFRIFFTATIWCKRSLSIQNRAEPVLRTQSEQGTHTIVLRFERLIRFLDRNAVPTGLHAGPRCCLGCCCMPHLRTAMLLCTDMLLCYAVLLCVYVLMRLCMCVFFCFSVTILAIFLV